MHNVRKNIVSSRYKVSRIYTRISPRYHKHNNRSVQAKLRHNDTVLIHPFRMGIVRHRHTAFSILG